MLKVDGALWTVRSSIRPGGNMVSKSSREESCAPPRRSDFLGSGQGKPRVDAMGGIVRTGVHASRDLACEGTAQIANDRPLTHHNLGSLPARISCDPWLANLIQAKVEQYVAVICGWRYPYRDNILARAEPTCGGARLWLRIAGSVRVLRRMLVGSLAQRGNPVTTLATLRLLWRRKFAAIEPDPGEGIS
jgi:hypothetical protein